MKTEKKGSVDGKEDWKEVWEGEDEAGKHKEAWKYGDKESKEERRKGRGKTWRNKRWEEESNKNTNTKMKNKKCECIFLYVHQQTQIQTHTISIKVVKQVKEIKREQFASAGRKSTADERLWEEKERKEARKC